MNEVTLSGALTGEPELRFTNNGKALCNFTVRFSPPAVKGQQRDSSFFDCTAWGQLAQNIAESFRDKDRVIVFGRLEQQKWEDRDGNKRSKVQIVAWAVGADVSYVTVEVTRNESSDQEAALAQF